MLVHSRGAAAETRSPEGDVKSSFVMGFAMDMSQVIDICPCMHLFGWSLYDTGRVVLAALTNKSHDFSSLTHQKFLSYIQSNQ